MNPNRSQTEKLLAKGVTIPSPETVEIGPEVDADRIAPGVVIHAGCRIFGKSTLILKGAKIGYEAPATLEDCHAGPNAELKGGFFKKAVFLEGASAGSGSHVREGTILEEKAGIAHTVGLKQTILFPFVTLGSLINFCDCLMAGGTGPKNHSEVGSSYIHFNFTPHQDKATPSLMGDVPRGVMLNQPPVFLGGQGGLVGPCRLAFGTIIAAGAVYRKDVLKPNRLIIPAAARGGEMSFTQGLYLSVKRIAENNLIYIANLMALMQWYAHVRSRFVSDDFPLPLLEGLQAVLNMGIQERIKRMRDFCQKMPESIKKYEEQTRGEGSVKLMEQKKELHERWHEVEGFLDQAKTRQGDMERMELFLNQLDSAIQDQGKSYLPVIKGLDPNTSETGVQWLKGIVTEIVKEAFEMLPSIGTARIE